MPLVFITGAPGSGKSTILQELRNQGQVAFGADEHGYSEWVNRQTGAVVTPPPDFDVHDWYRDHEWMFNTEAIAELKFHTSADSNIYLCGVAAGTQTVWQYFDIVIVLTVDEVTLKNRILERTNNNFGKTPEEFKAVMDWQDKHLKFYRHKGAIAIDTTDASPAEVTAKVLEISYTHD